MANAEPGTGKVEMVEKRQNVAPAGPEGSGRWLTLLALLPCWLAVGWLVSKAQWFWNHQPDLQFGWVVLMLCGYLFWEAWETRPEVRISLRPAPVILIGFAAVLLFVVQVYQAACGTNAASMVGLAFGLTLFIMGNLTSVFGIGGVRHFGFSFCFLLIALPMPSVVHNLVVGGLQSKIAALNVDILNLVGVPAQRVGSLIRLSTCTVGVDEACSGIRSLQSTVMATLFIGHLTLKSGGLRLVLVLTGIVLAVLGNLGRSLFLSYTANANGIQALERMHDTAGWSILLFTAIGVTAIAWLLARVETAACNQPRLPLDHIARRGASSAG